MATVIDAYWDDRGEGPDDIHVLRGRQTRALNDLLTILDDDDNEFKASETMKWAAVGITSIKFKGIFPFDLALHGIDVNETTGVVRTTPLPPPPQKRLSPNNFIVRAEVTGTSPNLPIVAKIRIHLHDSVTRVHLTPSTLTVRTQPPPSIPPSPLPATRARFTVLAEFDDGVIGNISRHGDKKVAGSQISWLSSSPANTIVTSEGWIHAQNGNAPPTTITATLPAELGAVPAVTGTVQNAPSWETPLPGGQPAVGKFLPESADPGAALAIPSLLFISDGFLAGEQAKFENLVRRLVKRWKRSRSTRPFDLVPMNYATVFVPSREKGTTIRNGLQFYGREPGKLWAQGIDSVEDFKITGASVTKIGELIHQVGLPIPAEADPTAANWKVKEKEWHDLYGRGHVGDVSLELYKAWVNHADYMLCLEPDTAFGMASGDFPPQAYAEDDGRGCGWHPFRAQRSDVDKLLNGMVDGAGHGMGGPWLTGRNRPFVLGVLAGARDCGAQTGDEGEELIASGLVDHSWTRLEDRPTRQVTKLIPHEIPSRAGNELFACFTHEVAHSLDLGDEYGGVKDTTAAGDEEVRAFYWNLQVDDDTAAAGILWKWPRILAAGLVTQNLANPGAAFQIQLQHPHGRNFGAGDRVRLRERPFLVYAAVPPPGTGNRLTYMPESNELEVVGAPVLNPAGDLLQVRTLAGVLSPPNWTSGKAILFKARGTLIVQADVDAFITAQAHAPLNRAVPAACAIDDKEIQTVRAPALMAQLKRGKPRYRSWIHGIYDGGNEAHCGVFHPSGACLMRTLRVPKPEPNAGVLYRFCHVCRYVLVDNLDPSQHGVIDADYEAIYPERR
jgi:hypothetical protein